MEGLCQRQMKAASADDGRGAVVEVESDYATRIGPPCGGRPGRSIGLHLGTEPCQNVEKRWRRQGRGVGPSIGTTTSIGSLLARGNGRCAQYGGMVYRSRRENYWGDAAGRAATSTSTRPTRSNPRRPAAPHARKLPSYLAS
jgi:hypothetical protein